MENPHLRRHPKLDATAQRKTNYENISNRRMNNTVTTQLLTAPDSPVVLLSVVKQILYRPGQNPERWHFPLYELSCAGASDHPGTGLPLQVKALDWIEQVTEAAAYTPFCLI